MKFSWFCTLLLAAIPAYGQAPQPTPVPPFRLNLRVMYNGAKTHPELAAFLYKSLRELPGVGLVDRDPDAILIVNEMARGNQYACTFTVLVPASEEVRSTVQLATSMYDGAEAARETIGETVARDSRIKPSWRKVLDAGIQNMQPLYHYGGGLVMIDASPKVAMGMAVKSLGSTYVEKEHRDYDYSLAHPVVMTPFQPPPPIYDPTPTPAPKPTPQPWTPPSSDFRLAAPPPTPFPLLGPDPLAPKH